MLSAPTLTAFAAPRGGAGLPWGGPAGGLLASAPTPTSFVAPQGAQACHGSARRES